MVGPIVGGGAPSGPNQNQPLGVFTPAPAEQAASPQCPSPVQNQPVGVVSFPPVQVTPPPPNETELNITINDTLFIGESIVGSTVGSILFVGAGNDLQQDPTKLFWDNATGNLLLGTNVEQHLDPGNDFKFPLQIERNQNESVYVLLTNETDGDHNTAGYIAKSVTASLTMGAFAPLSAFGDLRKAAETYILAQGGAGLVIFTGDGEPVRFGVANVEVGRFDYPSNAFIVGPDGTTLFATELLHVQGSAFFGSTGAYAFWNDSVSRFFLEGSHGPDSGTSPNGTLIIQDASNGLDNVLSFNVDYNVGVPYGYIQSRSRSDAVTQYALILNPSGGNIGINAVVSNWQSMDGGIFLGDTTTAPTGDPASGGFLYSNAGAGTWRGSGGTVTAFGPAGPHCGECGYDFWRVASHNDNWKASLRECGWCGKVYKNGPEKVLDKLNAQQRSELIYS